MKRTPADGNVARGGRPLFVLLTAVLAWTILAVARPMVHAGDGLVAEYFKNSTWTDPPAFAAVDDQPSTAGMMQRWHGVPPPQFSVRWSGFLTVGRPGAYTFATTSDDGSRLWIDGRLVVDNSGVHASATQSGQLELARGSHRVRLEYEQVGGDFMLTWSWARAGGRLSAAPSSPEPWTGASGAWRP
jgi:hypothetical protein